MRKSLDYILNTRDNTVGHWRFGGDLLDESGGDHTLSDVGSTPFNSGHTEEGDTTIAVDGTSSTGANIASAQATTFDMGSSDFSVEVWANLSNVATSGQLIKKVNGSVAGWAASVGSSRPVLFVGDGSNQVTCNGVANLAADKWYHFAYVVDRVNDQARIYVNGVEDGNSPFDISSITGNISAASDDLEVGENCSGLIDEICVSKEVLPPADVSFRAGGQLVDVSEYTPRFLTNFLPRIQHSPAMEEFLLPTTSLYLDTREAAYELGMLTKWNRCPGHYLNLFASLSNFELIDSEFSTTDDRRKFIETVPWLYQRKGISEAAQELLDLLGFTYEWGEGYPDWVPFIKNFHRIWDNDLGTVSVFSDDFSGNLSKWNPPQPPGYWQITNGKLRGTDDGTSSDLNLIKFDDTETQYYMEMKFQVVGGSINSSRIGMYLKFIDENNWVRLVIFTTALFDVDTLVLEKKVDGTTTPVAVRDISNLITHETGEHTLWVYADTLKGLYTIGVDDLVAAHDFSFYTNELPPTKKGLYLNLGLTIDFDDVVVKRLDKRLVAKLISSDFQDHVVSLRLLNQPSNYAAKKAYVQRVLPRYLPFYITLRWPQPVGSIEFVLETNGLTLKQGYILSGNRGAEFVLETNGLTMILGSVTITPSPTEFVMETQFGLLLPTPGSSEFVLETSGMTYLLQAVLEDGFAGVGGPQSVMNVDSRVIDGDKDTDIRQMGFEQYAGVSLSNGAVGITKLMLFDSNQSSDGLHADYDKVDIYTSDTNAYDSYTLKESFEAPPRVSNKTTITLSSATTEKYIKAIFPDGLRAPNATGLALTEIEVE
jgi:hypothetical protein